MARRCTVCQHPERATLDRALVSGPCYRSLAQQHGLTPWALLRHRSEHVPLKLAQAQDARATAEATDLLAEVRALRGKAVGLLLAAEREGDLRTALAGVREARACLELLAELQGALDRTPQVTLALAPEWLAVRGALLAALRPYPEAAAAVATRLVALDGAV